MLVVSVVSALVVVLARPWLVPPEIAGSWLLLAVYVFLFLNLEVLVSYWLAHGKSVQVMYYTLGVTVWRLATMLAATYWLRDVEMIFVTHGVRRSGEESLDLHVAARTRPAGIPLGRTGHARAGAPGGAAGRGSVLYKLNEFGKVVVGNQMGAVPMAIYTTAAYQVPLVNIVQGALADVIFPDMVKRSQRDAVQGLLLWKRAQVLIFAVICPAWALLTYWADPIVRLLFTDAYVGGRALLPGVPAADAAPVLPVLHAAAQRRGQQVLRACQPDGAGHQRGAHHRVDAALRTVGAGAGPGGWPGLDALSTWARAY